MALEERRGEAEPLPEALGGGWIYLKHKSFELMKEGGGCAGVRLGAMHDPPQIVDCEKECG